jgi:L-alanine-DL-glutamate epimerase-like enolase superfamily enzyme
VRIVRVDVYGYELAYAGSGGYAMSGGRVVETLASTVVRVTTDEGIAGFGETCPLGPAYLAAHAGGARAALAELAPAVLGLDPREPAAVYDRMDAALRGHGYAKSALDVACWDVLGRAAGLPVCTLLGGRRQASLPLYVAIPLGPVEEMVAEVERQRTGGVHRFQLKLGADPHEDAARVRAVLEATDGEDVVIADANGGWRLAEAMIAARLLDGLPRLFLEQPCPTLEECLSVRRHTSLPFVLDEVITDVGTFLRAWREQGMDAVNLKISRLGGLTPARQLRELAEAVGVSLTVEDSWGGDVVTATVAHLAASTRPEALLTVSFMNDWTREHVAGYEPRSRDGVGAAPAGPGLGVDVDVERLAEPLFSFAA